MDSEEEEQQGSSSPETATRPAASSSSRRPLGDPRRAAQLPRVPAVVRGVPGACAPRPGRRLALPPRRRVVVPGVGVRHHLQPRRAAPGLRARRHLVPHAGRLLPPVRGLRQLLFLDGGLRDDTAFVRCSYARELDTTHKAEAAHKAVFCFVTVRVEPPRAASAPAPREGAVARGGAGRHGGVVGVPHGGVPAGVRSVPPHLRAPDPALRGDLPHVRRQGARAAADEIFAEHRRIRTQLLATSHRYRAFIICCLVTITVSQLGALLAALSSRDAKSFANSGPTGLLVGSAVQLSGFFMCQFGAARIMHRAQRIVSIASQWHMSMVSVQHGKQPPAPASTSASDHDVSGSSTAAPAALQPELGAACLYESRQALLCHNGGGITLFGFMLDRGLLHTIFVFEMTLVLWILSKVVVLS
ncbi:hypothetical protein ACP70R_015724 [Stipagrostis hirtigluma subsp. patula]